MTRCSSETIAIDFGTTNTVVAYPDDISQRGECCINLEGSHKLPSAVTYKTADEYNVGTIAREKSLVNPEKTVLNVKRKIGIDKVALEIDGKKLSPEVVSSHILKEAANGAKNDLEMEIKNVIITVPVYYNAKQRKATVEACKLAGLNVKKIVGEPDAALKHYMTWNKLDGKNVLVFDLGGGTLDVTVAKVLGDKINVVAINGDTRLGGYDFDCALRDYVKEKYLKGKTLEVDDEQNLMSQIEKARITLSSKNATGFCVSTVQERVYVDITLEEFEKCTEHLLKKIRNVLEAILKDAKEKGVAVIDRAAVVGGATRMKQIEDLMKEYFGDALIVSKDRDEAVAKGAALIAKSVSDDEDIGINRISARSYGMAAMLESTGEQTVSNMIMISDAVPAIAKKTFYTKEDNQESVGIKVYENISREKYIDIKEEEFLGKCTLMLPKDLPARSEIEVIFSLDDNGLLTVDGLEPKSGKKCHTTMNSKALVG